MTTAELVQQYIKLRDRKAALDAEHKERVGKVSAVQSKIEQLLLSRFQADGVDSVKTADGTAYRSSRTSATIADWDMFKTFILSQDDPFEFIDKRAAKAAIENFKEQFQALPPGINWSESYTVNFRRS